MGGGSYSYVSATTRRDVGDETTGFTSYKSRSMSQNFKANRLDESMNLKGKVRECRDSEEHPQTFPIIIALDVTGSMGHIPQRLITNDFPEIMKKILDEGVKDPQVMFMGIGDHVYDSAPIQGGQFESSDELMEKWLTKTYLEGGGGGNDGESYVFAWLAAARNTVTDAYEKRGKKGVLITIGDEPNLKKIDVDSIRRNLCEAQHDMSTSEIFAEASEKWDIYHINVRDYAGRRSITRNSWREMLGDHMVETESEDGSDIIKIIPGIILKSYEENGSNFEKKSEDEPLMETDDDSSEHLL